MTLKILNSDISLKTTDRRNKTKVTSCDEIQAKGMDHWSEIGQRQVWIYGKHFTVPLVIFTSLCCIFCLSIIIEARNHVTSYYRPIKDSTSKVSKTHRRESRRLVYFTMLNYLRTFTNYRFKKEFHRFKNKTEKKDQSSWILEKSNSFNIFQRSHSRHEFWANFEE